MEALIALSLTMAAATTPAPIPLRSKSRRHRTPPSRRPKSRKLPWKHRGPPGPSMRHRSARPNHPHLAAPTVITKASMAVISRPLRQRPWHHLPHTAGLQCACLRLTFRPRLRTLLRHKRKDTPRQGPSVLNLPFLRRRRARRGPRRPPPVRNPTPVVAPATRIRIVKPDQSVL